MTEFNRKEHWENIYNTKELKDVSWYQPTPTLSLDFIKSFNLPTTAKIIDIGGGDSFLVDNLLELGYQNITVLDISKTAINRAKNRLGTKSPLVTWIIADVAQFKPTEIYDLWHDRAAFHFLTNPEDITNYVATVQSYLKPGGALVIGTFSEQGPKKCSGIEIRQYSESSLTTLFDDSFEKISSSIADHNTPFDTVQNFVFCSFRRR